MNIKTRRNPRFFECKRLLPAVALAVMLAGVTDSVLAYPPPAAATPESLVETISLADLDVSTPEGIRAARARLAKVAQRLCRKLGDARRVSDWATYTDCYRKSLADALRQVTPSVVAAVPRVNPPQH
jgi:UrcA family protein